MIITIRLVNIHHLIEFTKNLFFPGMKTFSIYMLSNFQTYHMILLTQVIMLYIVSPGFIYLITGSLYLLTYWMKVDWWF